MNERPSPSDAATHRNSAARSSGWRPERALGALALAALVAITLANVLVRYFTDSSFAWTEEISVFLLVALTLAGAASAASNDGHIRIEFLYARGSATRRRALKWLSAIATAVMFLLLTVLIARSSLEEFAFAETTSGLGVPRWWYSVWLPILAFGVAVRALQAARLGADTPEAQDAGAVQ